MAQELEFKYGLSDQAHFGALLDTLKHIFPGNWEKIKMETDYYDTWDRQLSAKRWTLRIRNEGGLSVLACKTPGQGRARSEWEVPEGTLPEGLTALVRRGAPDELMDLYHIPLRPWCGARYSRYRRIIDLDGTSVELALDRGVLMGHSKELPFWELECELKSGSPEVLVEWCTRFAQEQHLREEPKSKFSRAMALAGN